ncbi:MAG TPA: RHS repeat-associated core domain-containing protein [Candidatus Angelobacter sp.]|jgi:RHS repeat-associated protein
MKSAKLWVLLTILIAVSAPLIGQNNPNEEQGLKPYDSISGGDLDSTSLTSGGVGLHIPLAAFPQRGNLDLSFFVSSSNKQWYIKPAKFDRTGHQTSPPAWAPMPNTGVQIVSSTDWWLNSCTTTEPADLNDPGAPTLYDWSDSVSSPDGSSHLFGDEGAVFGGPAYPMRSADATGLLRPDAQTLILSNGTRYVYPGSGGNCSSLPYGRIRGGEQASSVTDANGNQITVSPSGWTDTMGRFIPGSASTAVGGIGPGVTTTDLSKCPSGTTSARIWNVPGISVLNGGIRTFYFCYSTFQLSTNFSSGNATNYGPAGNTLLSAVVLPDLTMWTFSYDNYGDVVHAGFPTGGSLSYTYSSGPYNSSAGTGFSTWVTSRTVDANDGTGGHKWSYNFQGNFPTGNGTAVYSYGQKGVATVTDPDGNDVVHTIGPGSTGGCPGYEYQTQYFQGPASGGVVLKTVQSQYDCTMGAAGGNLEGIALNAVPIQVTTILRGGQTSKAVSSYDPTVNDVNGDAARIGSVLQRDEYDFSGSLVRSTLVRYIWQDNATYKTNNLVALPEWSTTYNGEAPPSPTLPACSGSSTPVCISQSKYAYDEGALSASNIGTPTHLGPPAGEPIRGNSTTNSHWLDTAGAFISSTSTYYDTGVRATTTDPLGHTTRYAYSGSFLGAYLTQTTLPDTQMPDSGAPIVHHVVSGNYDFNSGVLTSFTDQNGQPYTYTYDIMLRLIQGNHPDGGITKFFYPDPNTVERQRLITGTMYDDFKVKFDGVGRPYQTLQFTPDCTGWIKVDTTYDTVGRAKSVSNPYCLTSEPTYGTTQSAYDALSRTLTTTKQDQSVTSVKYDDTPGDTSGAPLVCTTATDESGKKRQGCSDAFGRLVKAIEPNPASTATTATGSLTVSGTEQSANSQPATSGRATIGIGGFEVTAQSCIGTRCFTIYDTGRVTVTVAGFPAKTVGYGRFDTAATVAWALSCAFHNDTASAADASCPVSAGTSTQVVLTARATGTASDYSFTTSSATDDGSTNFFNPSFTATPASGAFSGAQNASSTPDTGSVAVTLNGTPYSTSFGSGDTSTTIVSRLATAISAGPYASATASGGTLNLTSKTSGTIGDYPLTASYTWNSAQFTNPSFTTSTSGSTLSGAKDAGGINNNPFVTLYQYDARGDMLCIHQKATDITADVPCTGTTPPVVPATWRQRFFAYDSLSRLRTAMNPELNSTGSTMITYNYDNNSRLISKVEPAPNAAWGYSSTVTVNYTYDAMNRLLDTTYSDGTTQGTSHRYDYTSFLGQTFTNPIGREVAATSAGNTIESFASYDQMGRVARTVQCNPGVTGCKTFTPSYDKLGDLTSLAYPGNGFTVTYGYDSAARLTTAADSNGVIYAQTPTYLASGAIKEFTSPNFANNKYHVNYNNRLQPVEIWVGSAQGAPALFDKEYSYGTARTNNGNIFTITNVKDSTRTQTFAYDPLNRLITAGDNGHWANSYTYDAWGNLTNKNPGAPAGENMNQAADANNHLSGLTYDAAGNVINDGLGGVFVFDGENRIKTAGSATYTYDAAGRRIQKSTGTNYWYGPGGNVFAETDSAGNWTNYIFFGGQRLARNLSGDIKYYITDHLHSTAMFVDKAGTTAAILDDNDMYPWGGVVPGVGKTTSNNTIKFTGQYRDTDTAANLDYFGARYYSYTIGRFMSPDWADRPTTVPYAKFGDPQSLNLYTYTENGPINRIDSNGHWEDADCTVCSGNGSGFSVGPNVGSGVGLVNCPTCQGSQTQQLPGPIANACANGCSLQVTPSLSVDEGQNGTINVTQTETYKATTDNGDGTTSITSATVTTSITLPSNGAASDGAKASATQSVTGAQTTTVNNETGQAVYQHYSDTKQNITMVQAYQAIGGPGTQGTFNGYQIVQNIVVNTNQQRTAQWNDQLKRHAEGEDRTSWGHFAHAVSEALRELFAH